MSILKSHSLAWYKQLAAQQNAQYRYPWSSMLPDYNGESVFLDMVTKAMKPDSIVLDAGCADGSLTLDLAKQCQSIYGYDFLPEFIEKAKWNQQRLNIRNADFVVHDSSGSNAESNLPFADSTFDLIVSRRGPTSFIKDARRILKPGGRMIQLNPAVAELPDWADRIPKVYHHNLGGESDDAIQEKIQQRLTESQLKLDAYWWFDVPEIFHQAKDLYQFLNWGFFDERPHCFAELEPVLNELFSSYRQRGGVCVRQRRFLWTSVVFK